MIWSRVASMPFVKYISHYLAYQLIVWLVHMVLISFISFFHFLLDHRLSVIEEWAFANAWQISIMTKAIAAFAVLKFILVKSDLRIFRAHLEESVKIWRVPYYIYVCVTFLFLFLLWSGNPTITPNRDFSLIDTFIAYFGTFCFFGTDLLVLFFLLHFYHLRRGELFITALISTVIFFGSNKIVLVFNREISAYVGTSFLLLFYLMTLDKNRFVYPLLFLLAIYCPFAGLFGLDPLWGNSRAFLYMTSGISLSSQIISLIIIINYISLKRIGARAYIRYLKLLGKKTLTRVLVAKRRV